MKKILISAVICAAFVGLLLPACRHELGQLPLGPIDPTDTTVVVVIPPDTVDTTGVPCSADTVYFQNQILPLLNSSCALSGCHNVQSHKEGVITTDYAHIMQNVKAFNLNQSKIYTSIITTSADDRMPPPPAAAFTTDQKNLVKKWIEQGALNNVCNESYGQCDTTHVTYAGFIQPLIANKCLGCHTSAGTGGGVLLTTYSQVVSSVQTGKFYGSINWTAGVSAMPKNGAKMSTCQISKVKSWIDAGLPQ